MPFKPKRVFFEKQALDYPLGQTLFRHFSSQPLVEVKLLSSHNRVTGIPGKTPREAYNEGKRTLVVGVRKTLDFQTCKPSAHFQLPLVTGCMGQCEYCYLNTQLGKRPYVRVYVNIDQILEQAQRYIVSRAPEITVFEGAATSDPVPVEPYTGALARAVNFFAGQEWGRFRFVSKFTDIENLLSLEHNRHTTVRFSINADHIIKTYEHATPRLPERLKAAARIAAAGYPLGLMVGPVIIFPGWEKEYQDMLRLAKEALSDSASLNLHFEIITHRFTARAKKNILDVYPATTLPMDEVERRYKFGQFGYGKFVYTPEHMTAIADFFGEALSTFFPEAKLDYLV